MKKLFAVLLILLPVSWAAAKTTILPGLMKPNQIAVDRDYLFVTDRYDLSIRVYSLGNFKLIKKFGKKGEGPGEFTMTPIIFLKKKEIMVFTGFKFYLFSKLGTLLEEKHYTPLGLAWVEPLKDDFVMHLFSLSSLGRDTEDVNLCNNKFQVIKTIYSRMPPKYDKKKPLSLVNPNLSVRASAAGIFIADAEKGFYIEIFNPKGEKIKTVNRDYKKIKVTPEQRRKIKKNFLDTYAARKYKAHFLKREYAFPEYFPAVDEIFLSGKKIYVKTFFSRDGKTEYLILDLEGNLIKSVFLPEAAFSTRFFLTIKNDTFYYLRENEELEEWEIQTVKIN